MTTEEKVVDEFYSREDRRDVQLIRKTAGTRAPWYVITYSDQPGAMLGFNDEHKAKEAFRRLKIQAQNP